MPLTPLTQDEIVQILTALRLLMDKYKTNLRDEGYVNQGLIDAIQMCQELFDQHWDLLDSTSMAACTSRWYPQDN